MSSVETGSYRQQPMILQYDRLAIPQRFRNPLPLLAVEDHPAEPVVHGMALVEPQRVLRHHVERLAEDGERLAGDAVRVAGGDDVWSGFVDLSQLAGIIST